MSRSRLPLGSGRSDRSTGLLRSSEQRRIRLDGRTTDPRPCQHSLLVDTSIDGFLHLIDDPEAGQFFESIHPRGEDRTENDEEKHLALDDHRQQGDEEGKEIGTLDDEQSLVIISEEFR